jgi:hypothetical protein
VKCSASASPTERTGVRGDFEPLKFSREALFWDDGNVLVLPFLQGYYMRVRMGRIEKDGEAGAICAACAAGHIRSWIPNIGFPN